MKPRPFPALPLPSPLLSLSSPPLFLSSPPFRFSSLSSLFLLLSCSFLYFFSFTTIHISLIFISSKSLLSSLSLFTSIFIFSSYLRLICLFSPSSSFSFHVSFFIQYIFLLLLTLPPFQSTSFLSPSSSTYAANSSFA